MFRLSSLRFFLVISFISVWYIGCGGSEEAVSEDEMVTDTGVTEETPQEETPAQTETPVEQPAQEEPVQHEGPTKEQLQSELDALKSENMQLREENSTLQLSNKDLSTKVSDLEAANAALASAPKRHEPAKMEKHTAMTGKSSPEEIQAYENGVSKAKNRNYHDAMGDMQALLNGGIKDDFADNCHYWLGECSYQLKEYSQAIQHFEMVQGYKYSEKKDDAQLMIAQCYERLGDKSKARAEYQKLVDMYPTSEYIKRAKSKL